MCDYVIINRKPEFSKTAIMILFPIVYLSV